MNVSLVPDVRMNMGQFLAWSELHPEPEDQRYELIDGEVIAISRIETVGHCLAKGAAVFSLHDAVRAGGLPWGGVSKGTGVAINDDTMRLPDVFVLRGPIADWDATVVQEPVIVVEVVASESEASNAMLRDYASVARIHHYLISNWESRTVTHHYRNEHGVFDTRIMKDGDIVLNPPGLSVSVAAFLGEED